jgi:hypothetical protein
MWNAKFLIITNQPNSSIILLSEMFVLYRTHQICTFCNTNEKKSSLNVSIIVFNTQKNSMRFS